MLKKRLALFFIGISILFSNFTITFAEDAYEEGLEISAKAAILMEQESGRILYSKNATEKMYPASMTKILTALIATEYIEPDEIVFAGNEINSIPDDSSKAGNFVGESIIGENLIRLVIIPSGNETACIVAQNVARKASGNSKMNYEDAEKYFSEMMNEKAKELKAFNSNFVNPHGYHDSNHYSTAEDIALISRKAMENPLIRRIVAEEEFNGNGAGSNPKPSWKTKNYSLKTHNFLISTEDDDYYKYATGIKTGFTNEAGSCLAASAEKNGTKLISVVMFSKDPERWQESEMLLEYGFNNFSHTVVQEENQKLESAKIANNKLGESAVLKLSSVNEFKTFLKHGEIERIEKKIVFDEELLAPPNPEVSDIDEEEELEEEVELLAPITKDQVVGRVVYTLDGEEIFEDEVIAQRDVEERTKKTDREYYWAKFKATVFSIKAIPFWVGGVILIIIIIILINNSRRNRRDFYKPRRRY